MTQQKVSFRKCKNLSDYYIHHLNCFLFLFYFHPKSWSWENCEEVNTCGVKTHLRRCSHLAWLILLPSSIFSDSVEVEDRNPTRKTIFKFSQEKCCPHTKTVLRGRGWYICDASVQTEQRKKKGSRSSRRWEEKGEKRMWTRILQRMWH